MKVTETEVKQGRMERMRSYTHRSYKSVPHQYVFPRTAKTQGGSKTTFFLLDQ